MESVFRAGSISKIANEELVVCAGESLSSMVARCYFLRVR